MAEVLTQELLKEYLNYCTDTGIFTWIKKSGKKTVIGSVAGSISKRDSHIEIRLKGKLYRAHRLAWLYMTGKFPTLHIDHIDHNEQNNVWANLREVTQEVNNMNMSKKSSNKTGVTGVWINPKFVNKKYVAEVYSKGKKYYLGAFVTLEEAVNARQLKLTELGFHANHGQTKPYKTSTTNKTS